MSLIIKNRRCAAQCCETVNKEYDSCMSKPVSEINCLCGKLSVSSNRKEVFVESSDSKVGVDKLTFSQVLEQASQPCGLISSDNQAHAVDSQGHQIEVVIHHRPSDPRSSSWANIKVDGCRSLQLDTLQLSQLRNIL